MFDGIEVGQIGRQKQQRTAGGDDSARVGQPDISLGNAILLSMRWKTAEEAEEEIAAADARFEEHEKYFRNLAGR